MSPIRIWKVWNVSKGKSFIHQRASDCDFFSPKKKKKKTTDCNHRVNDMYKLHLKVWKVLLYY